MKKTIILLLGVVLLLNGSNLKNIENNSSKKEWRYSYKISKEFLINKDKTKKYMFTDYEVRNKQGLLIQKRRSTENFTYTTRYYYNKNKEKIKEEFEMVDSTSHDISVTYYSESGKKIKEEYSDIIKPLNNYIRIYSYDKKGELKEIKIVDVNNRVTDMYKVEKNNSKNNNIKIEYNKEGKPIRKVKETNSWSSHTHLFDSKPLEKIQYYGKKITTYNYNTFGNEIKKEFIDQYDRIDKQIYLYNDNRELLSEHNSSDRNQSIIEHYIIYTEYDKQNNLTKKYSKVFKSISGCRGGLSYATPNYEKIFVYDKEDRLIEIDEKQYTTLYISGKRLREYHTEITYEYREELLYTLNSKGDPCI